MLLRFGKSQTFYRLILTWRFKILKGTEAILYQPWTPGQLGLPGVSVGASSSLVCDQIRIDRRWESSEGQRGEGRNPNPRWDKCGDRGRCSLARAAWVSRTKTCTAAIPGSSSTHGVGYPVLLMHFFFFAAAFASPLLHLFWSSTSPPAHMPPTAEAEAPRVLDLQVILWHRFDGFRLYYSYELEKSFIFIGALCGTSFCSCTGLTY